MNIYVKRYISMFSVSQGTVAEKKIWHSLIADYLSNNSAKYYENLTMLSRVIATNIGDVF